MCGFVGALSSASQPVQTELLNTAADLLVHRGPDDAATISFSSSQAKPEIINVSFAFRRLAIQDLSAHGRQPMSNADGSLTLVFNGEIYNAPELRRTYIDPARVFNGRSDTEVILALYESLGEQAFSKLNGMFAIALWDSARQKLYLVRDRIGIKPLYYSYYNDTLLFASEIKPILAYRQGDNGFDACGLLEHFSFQYCLGERTVYRGIFNITPGTYHVYDPAAPTKILHSQQYWDMQFDPQPQSIDTFAEELKTCLQSVITRQTRSDVPVGTFLSSGMDTGAISALAKPLIPHLHSFTCGFDTRGMVGLESFFDETVAAAALADQLGTEHHNLHLSSTALPTLFRDVVWHMEDPRVGISYQIYAMAEQVKRHVTVVLSGTGGDELFAGYGWRYEPVLSLTTPSAFNDYYYRAWLRLIPEQRRSQVFTKTFLRGTSGFSTRDSFNQVMAACQTDDPLHRALYFDMKGFLPGVLMMDDKLNMAHSVEARVPFLDNELLALAGRMPSAFKFDGVTTKKVLKQALRGILPDDVIERRKQGFTPPEAHWMRTKHVAWIKERLLCDTFLDLGIFKREGVQALLDEHMTGQANHRFVIWSLLCVSEISRLFIQQQQPCVIGSI